MNTDFARTKILCTLGPATDSSEKLKAIYKAGVDGFRLNFSHGDHEYFEKLLAKIKNEFAATSNPVALLADLQGPKIRVGELIESKIFLEEGKIIEVTSKEVAGTDKKISVSYDNIAKEASIGDKLLIDDGIIRLAVENVKEDSLICRVIEGGFLKPRKGVNLPGMKLSAPALTEKDYSDLEFIIQRNFDYIALSFVRTANDIKVLRNYLKEKNCEASIIAKIEKSEAVENFDEILEVADGIMVARGDLGVEVETHEVPIIQKKIIEKCNQTGKLCITATQMLESMINNPLPTRAEASDVANAVWDGTDVVMLSAETSVGSHPVDAVKVMNKILQTAESNIDISRKIDFISPKNFNDNLFDSIGKAVASIAEQTNALAIVVFTHYGRKARSIAKFRPASKIYAFSDQKKIVGELSLVRGVVSNYLEGINDEDNAIKSARKFMLENRMVKEGDVLVYTAGSPLQEKGRRNWIRVDVI